MKISVYNTKDYVYEIVREGATTPTSYLELLATGEHTAVMLAIQMELLITSLDIAESAEFVALNEAGGKTAINTENLWLLQEVEIKQRARIIKNPDGTTETNLRTWKGSLPLVVNALYVCIEQIDAAE